MCDDQYYHSGRDSSKVKTDSEYADDLVKFMDGKPIKSVIIDPSAASFKAELRKRGIPTKDAINDVLDGIRLTASLFGQNIIQVNKKKCPNLIREFQSYVWDTKKSDQGEDVPLKQNDHGPDASRYILLTCVGLKRRFTQS